jgi:hypothetical protein
MSNGAQLCWRRGSGLRSVWLTKRRPELGSGKTAGMAHVVLVSADGLAAPHWH